MACVITVVPHSLNMQSIGLDVIILSIIMSVAAAMKTVRKYSIKGSFHGLIKEVI